MKIEIKQSFAIDDKEYKVKSKGKAAIHDDVPAYFCFIAFFISLVKSGAVKILEVRAIEFKDLPEKYSDKDISHEDLELMHEALEAADVEQDEESEEDDSLGEPQGEPNDEEHSTPSSESAPAEPVNAEPASEPEIAEQVEEPKAESQASQVEKSDDQIEFEMLEEKKLRLTNKEKKRHAELKAIL